MNILISAYSCSPKHGSEGGMVWRVVSTMAKYHNVFVITDDKYKVDIENEIISHKIEKLHFYFNPVPEKVRKMCDNQGDWRFYYFYRKWQKNTLEIAKEITKKHHIDVVHQLGMITFREPGYLIELKIPFIWGPIGGMSTAPINYLKGVSVGLKLKYCIKNCITRFQYRFVPRIVKTIKNADVLIAANASSYKVLSQIYKKNVVRINETGCDSAVLHLNKKCKKTSFDILWVGRFLPTKLLLFSLEVLSCLKDLPNLKLHIIGAAFNDSETQKYKMLAEKLGVGDLCKWHGWVDHEEVQRLMQDSDVMFFPSVVEGTPHVILESVANNLPVVCFDTCGQADIIDDSIGIKIPLTNYKQSISDFSAALKDLFYDRDKIQQLSDNCNLRKPSLSGDAKINKYLNIYERVLNKKLQ